MHYFDSLMDWLSCRPISFQVPSLKLSNWHLKIGNPKRKRSYSDPSIFRCELLGFRGLNVFLLFRPFLDRSLSRSLLPSCLDITVVTYFHGLNVTSMHLSVYNTVGEASWSTIKSLTIDRSFLELRIPIKDRLRYDMLLMVQKSQTITLDVKKKTS